MKDLDIGLFERLCSQGLDRAAYPLAGAVHHRIPIYSGDTLRKCLVDAAKKHIAKAELLHCLKDGPGVFAITQFYDDVAPIAASNKIFQRIIAREKATNEAKGDHFAKPGANDRIWNSLQKVCELDAATFVEYYKNPLLSLVSEAWLGPYFQLTAQVNVVKPGGVAQEPHRDYHLGFQSDETVARFPVEAQTMSQWLTLQGAIAHSDMPVESGPTLLLPFSQQYELGYLAWRHPAFNAYFKQHAVQLSLATGDALFLNPALFHAAGTNKTASHQRIANLLQISSAFGKTMETIDHYAMVKNAYPVLRRAHDAGVLNALELDTVLTVLADAYSFPTNLDKDPPLYGAAPQSMRQLTEQALQENWSSDQLNQALIAHQQRRFA